MDVKRLPRPTSWEMLRQEIDYVIENQPSTVPQPAVKTPVPETISESYSAPEPENNSQEWVTLPSELNIPDNIPKALADLMKANSVSEEEIRFAVSNAGFFPNDTPISNYPPDFVNGMLIAKWGGIYKKICENRELPFT